MYCASVAGLRIQRMPSEADTEFGNPANYPYMCVASPSCHDTSTTRAWYEEDPDRRQRFYSNVGSEAYITVFAFVTSLLKATSFHALLVHHICALLHGYTPSDRSDSGCWAALRQQALADPENWGTGGRGI